MHQAGRKLGEFCSEVVSASLGGASHIHGSSVNQVKVIVRSVSKKCPGHHIPLCVSGSQALLLSEKQRQEPRKPGPGGLLQRLGGAPLVCQGLNLPGEITTG